MNSQSNPNMEFYKYNPFRRWGALAIDTFFLSLVILPFAFLILGILGYSVAQRLIEPGLGIVVYYLLILLISIFGILLRMYYHAYFIEKEGQTQGQKLMGLRLVTTEGKTPSFKTVALRYLCYLIPYSTIISGIMILCTEQKTKIIQQKVKIQR